MRNMIAGMLVLAVLLVACYGGRVDRDVVSPLERDTGGFADRPVEQPEERAILMQGTFSPPAEGTARIIDRDGQLVLEIEGLYTRWEPDVSISLAADDSAADAVRLGDLRAPKGDQRYPVPWGIDLQRHDRVVIRSASMGTFAVAPLAPPGP